MGSYLNLHTFFFLLVFTCSFLEIYGRGGRGGGFGGGFSSRGGYSSRGSSSSRSSSGSSSSHSSSGSSSSRSSSGSSSSRSSSGSSNGHSSSGSSNIGNSASKSSNSYGSSGNNYGSSRNRYGSSSSGSYGSGLSRRRNNYGAIPVNTANRRTYGGSSGSSWENSDYEFQDHNANKLDDTERTNYAIPRYTTSRPWPPPPPSLSNSRKFDEWWNKGRHHTVREPEHPFQREVDRIHKDMKAMQEASIMDWTKMRSSGYRRKRASPSQDKLRSQETRDEKLTSLVSNSQA